MSLSQPLLKVEDLRMHFPVLGGILQRPVAYVKAVDGVSLEIQKGDVLGVVGESGCGKSTLARAILQLERDVQGRIFYEGRSMMGLSRKALRPFRKEMQIVFQDPFFSLSPRQSIEEILEEPLEIHRIGDSTASRRKLILETLQDVGLHENVLGRFPHEFSGGQRQRIGIARALILRPKLIVADEPVSALDVSIQSQILNLLKRLQREHGLTYLFISHDLGVVEFISSHVAVMYLGKIVEKATRESLFRRKLHPYTEALISAIPEIDPERRVSKRIVLKGDIPSPMNPPSGCRFRTRCAKFQERCRLEVPGLRNYGSETSPHWVACHFPNGI